MWPGNYFGEISKSLAFLGVKNRKDLGNFYKDDVRYIKASNGM